MHKTLGQQSEYQPYQKQMPGNWQENPGSTARLVMQQCHEVNHLQLPQDGLADQRSVVHHRKGSGHHGMAPLVLSSLPYIA